MESEIRNSMKTDWPKRHGYLGVEYRPIQSGLLIDHDFLKQLKRKYPNLIIVGDGTQFLGAHRFTLIIAPFDDCRVLATNGYWQVLETE